MRVKKPYKVEKGITGERTFDVQKEWDFYGRAPRLIGTCGSVLECQEE